jgi:hypothetical protein
VNMYAFVLLKDLTTLLFCTSREFKGGDRRWAAAETFE